MPLLLYILNSKTQGLIGGGGQGIRPALLLGNQKLRGPLLDIWGEAWSFCLAIFIYFTREIESFNLLHHRIGCKYYSNILLYLFQPPVWVKYLFPPYLVVIYLFHPFFLQKYLFPKISRPPSPSPYSNGGPLSFCNLLRLNHPSSWCEKLVIWYTNASIWKKRLYATSPRNN